MCDGDGRVPEREARKGPHRPRCCEQASVYQDPTTQEVNGLDTDMEVECDEENAFYRLVELELAYQTR